MPGDRSTTFPRTPRCSTRPQPRRRPKPQLRAAATTVQRARNLPWEIHQNGEKMRRRHLPLGRARLCRRPLQRRRCGGGAGGPRRRPFWGCPPESPKEDDAGVGAGLSYLLIVNILMSNTLQVLCQELSLIHVWMLNVILLCLSWIIFFYGHSCMLLDGQLSPSC